MPPCTSVQPTAVKATCPPAREPSETTTAQLVMSMGMCGEGKRVGSTPIPLRT